MKRVFLAIAAFFALVTTSFAEENLFGFSFEPIMGLRNGVVNEFVYLDNTVTKEEYHLSQLDWNIKNSFYAGCAADLRIQKFHFGVNLKSFATNTNGTIEDSDWMQDACYKTGNTSTKTNFSKHDETLDKWFSISLEGRYEFSPLSFWTISPTIGFTYETFSLTGTDGKGWYGFNSDRKRQTSLNDGYFYSYDSAYKSDLIFTGNIIRLEHKDYYVWLGFSTKFTTPDEHWVFYADFSVAPYTYMLVRDSHYLKMYYVDIVEQNFSAFKAATFVQFKFNKMFAVKLAVSGLLTTELKGIEYTSPTYDGKYKRNDAVIGAAAKYFDIQLSGSFTF